MRYLSVCSGIEAASVAWHHMGWTPVAFSEIEPFPSAVLALGNSMACNVMQRLGERIAMVDELMAATDEACDVANP